MTIAAESTQWLLAGDPAIRWQTQRDSLAGDAVTVASEQRRIAAEGSGGRLLSLQDPAGTWADGMHTPKWKSTTYTMLLLRQLGLSPDNSQAERACTLLLDSGICDDGGIGYGFRPETCVTGIVLSILS